MAFYCRNITAANIWFLTGFSVVAVTLWSLVEMPQIWAKNNLTYIDCNATLCQILSNTDRRILVLASVQSSANQLVACVLHI